MKSVCFVKIVYSNKFPMMSSRSKKDEVLHEPKAGFKNSIKITVPILRHFLPIIVHFTMRYIKLCINITKLEKKHLINVRTTLLNLTV